MILCVKKIYPQIKELKKIITLADHGDFFKYLKSDQSARPARKKIKKSFKSVAKKYNSKKHEKLSSSPSRIVFNSNWLQSKN
jgi:hypothetical protein